MKQKTDVLRGTLALIVLRTLEMLGPLRGYGTPGAWSRSVAIARFFERPEFPR